MATTGEIDKDTPKDDAGAVADNIDNIGNDVEVKQTPQLNTMSDVWYDADGNPTDKATAEKDAAKPWVHADDAAPVVDLNSADDAEPDYDDEDHQAWDKEENDAIETSRAANKAQMDAYDAWLTQHPLETEEQRKKREKAERANRIIASIGDAGAAVANIIATSQYAPNAQYESLGDKLKEEYDKKKIERDATAEKHLNYALQMGKLKQEGVNSVRDIRKYYQALRDARLKAEREEANAEREAEEHEWKREEQPYKKAEAEAKAKYWETNAGIKAVDLDNEQKLKDSVINKNNRTGLGKSGGGGKKRSGGGKKGSGSKDYVETTVRDGKDKYGRPTKTTTTKTRHYGSGGKKSAKSKISIH